MFLIRRNWFPVAYNDLTNSSWHSGDFFDTKMHSRFLSFIISFFLSFIILITKALYTPFMNMLYKKFEILLITYRSVDFYTNSYFWNKNKILLENCFTYWIFNIFCVFNTLCVFSCILKFPTSRILNNEIPLLFYTKRNVYKHSSND